MILFKFINGEKFNNWLIPAKIIILLLLFSNCNKPHLANKSSPVQETKNNESIDGEKLLRHVVFFKFKKNATTEEIDKVVKAFADLPNKIKEIKDFEWGVNNSPENLNKGFTHSFFLTFHSEKGREIYLPHPDHKLFGELVGPIIEDVLVIDYWAKD